jgi:PTS system sucrose-specific IIC component
MDYAACAKAILQEIGGRENLVSAAHCATRLRLVVVDESKCSPERLENIEGVKGVFAAAGQLQIIIGTGTVNKVYSEFIAAAGIEAATKEDVKKAAANKSPWYKRAIKTLGDVFVPIIPAIVASGLLMGLLEGIANVFPAITSNGTYTIIHLFSNAAFVFLPVLIATSAAKVFGGNQFLGAVIGMIMIHPDLLNAWSVAGAADIPSASVWFGLYNVNLVGYQGHVIPVIIAVWLMSVLEKKLHKIVPEMIDLFVTPLVSVLVTGYVTLTIIGPVFGRLENGVLAGMQALLNLPYGLGGAICGGLYALTVVAGVHHMYNALEAGLLSATGFNIWMPIATAANVAQGGAALAFSFKTHSKKQKSVALPASLSAFLGITEPAIFGVNLRFMRPFLAALAGGAAGGLIAGMFHVSATAYGITGLFGILITTHNLLAYLLVMAVAFAVSFGLTMVLYRDREESVSAAPDRAGAADDGEIASPVAGAVVPLKDVPDATFAEGVLGQGIAVQPSQGRVVAPCDAVVSTLFETHHAIGLQLPSGAEVLIHVGINTVELDGEGFMAHVGEGDAVKRGQVLLTFDTALIESKGYKTVTPVIVTNSDDYDAVEPLAQGAVEELQPLLRARKGSAVHA